MQTTLLPMAVDEDTAWMRAAKKECIDYGEHGDAVEVHSNGTVTCFNCGCRL